MDHNAYQLLALGARYWFVLLAAVLVWRGAAALLHEHYRRKKLLKKLPDAGMVGEMRDIDNDRAYPLPREGVLGGGRACDIRLRGLRRRDIICAFVEVLGLLLSSGVCRGVVLLDGLPLVKGGYALHGAMLRVGGYTLRIRLFAGLNVPRPAPYEEHWHSAYEDEELYAPEYAAAQLGCAPYSEGAYDQPGMPVPPAFQTFDTLSMPAVNAAPQPVYPQQPACPPQPVYPDPAQAAYAQPAQPVYPAQAAYPAAPAEEDAAAPAPFDGGMYAPKAEEIPAPFEAPRRHRRSDWWQGK